MTREDIRYGIDTAVKVLLFVIACATLSGVVTTIGRSWVDAAQVMADAAAHK